MSSLYNLEPQPTASCILHTTAGDISLELWAQQTPLTCRNFLQHCVDGYYNNTIFHRLVPGFIIQGGDPTGTGSGGESIYDAAAYSQPREKGGIWPMEDRKGKNAGINGIGFKDEWHSRIKYNRRGLLGMANDGTENSNGSQFFITLGNTPELQGKNTLFGRVEGETIYNVAKMGEMEIGERDRPLYPTKITSVEVLVNPFNDMVKRMKAAPATAAIQKNQVGEKRKRKRKSGKQLLSFDSEDGEDTQQILVKKSRKFDTRIVTDNQNTPGLDIKPSGGPKEVRKKAVKLLPLEVSPEPALSPTPEALPNRAATLESGDMPSSPEPVLKVSSILDQTNTQIAELKASMKRSVHLAPVKETKRSVLEEMIPKTSIRGRKRHPSTNATSRDEQRAVDILNAFQSKLDQAPPEKTNAEFAPAMEQKDDKDEAGEDEEAILCDLHFIADCKSCSKWDAQTEADQDANDDIGWMSHVLSFKEDKLGKDLTYRKRAEEELVVIDPREKARSLKEEKKAQREARSGVSGREWDKARNDKLARVSALAGRGGR